MPNPADTVEPPHLADAFELPSEFETVFELIKQALHDGLVIQEAAGRIVFFNPKAVELLRMTPAELLGASSLDARWQSITADGDPFPGEHHPTMRSLNAGEQVRGEIMGVRRGDESVGWLSIDSYPVDLPSGRFAVAVFTDITASIDRARELHATQAEIQRQLIQHEFPNSERVAFSSAYRSAGVTTSIGGDFLGVYRHDPDRHGIDRIGCFVGDVCGHGVRAAGLSSVARNTVRAVGPLLDDPDQVLGRLHEVVEQEWPEMFVTAVYAMLRFPLDGPATLSVACGGHPLPILVRDGVAATVGTTGPLVGMVPNASRPVTRLELRPRDRILLYTDGVLDGASPRLSTDELASILPTEARLDDMIDWMMALGRFGGGPIGPSDDSAVLGIEIL